MGLHHTREKKIHNSERAPPILRSRNRRSQTVGEKRIGNQVESTCVCVCVSARGTSEFVMIRVK